MTISAKEIVNLSVENIRPNPYQPRRIFDQNGLDELAQSIKTYGVLQPVSVRLMSDGNHELVSGERRLRASKLAGIETIPTILVEITDTDSAIIALIENLQRRDLHFFEEAEGFSNLMNDYAFTQEALAARIGKNQSTIANKLRLLKISRPVQKIIIENELTERHARALLRINNEEEQLSVLEKVIKDGLTVRKTEDLIDKLLKVNNAKDRKNFLPHKAYLRHIRLLTNYIKEDLEIMQRSGMDTQMDVQETENGYNIQISLTYAQVAAEAVS